MNKALIACAAALATAHIAFAARYFMQGGRPGSATPYGDNAQAARYVDVDDIRIYCETYGEGEPLVMFHGGGLGSPYEMGGLIDALCALKRYQVTVVSTRGHGRTPPGRHRMSLERRAEDAAAVVRAVAPGRKAALVGFSDGAYTALAVGVHHPELAGRIVAIGAGTVKPGAFPSTADVSAWQKMDLAYADYLRGVMPEFDRWQEYASDYMLWWSRAAVGRDFFSRIKSPVLFIAGDEDDHAPVATVAEAFEMTPKSRLAIIPKAWHTCFLDNFDATWAAIRPFVETPIANLAPSKKVAPPSAGNTVTTELLREDSSWDGAALPPYPAGKTELVANRVTIPAHAELAWHHHELMSFGVVEQGTLTLVKRTGEEKAFSKGEVFVETVGSVHRGENRGETDTVVTVFYAATPGAPLSTGQK